MFCLTHIYQGHRGFGLTEYYCNWFEGSIQFQKKIFSSTSRIFQNSAIPSFPEGRKHDASMLDESGVLNELERHAFWAGNDPAYPHRVHLQRTFQYGVLTHQMQKFQ